MKMTLRQDATNRIKAPCTWGNLLRHPGKMLPVLLLLAVSAAPAMFAAVPEMPPPVHAAPQTAVVQAALPAADVPVAVGRVTGATVDVAPKMADSQKPLLRKITWDSVRNWQGLELWRLLFCCIGILVAFLVGRLVRWIIETIVKKRITAKTETEVDDAFCDALGKPAGTLVMVGLWYASMSPVSSQLPDAALVLFNRAFTAVAAATVAWFAFRLVEVLAIFLQEVTRKSGSELDLLILSVVRKCLKVVVVVVAVLFIGQNVLNWNITALLAGAGVAGLAVAFAAQDTIANFFGSIMVVIDQPFKVGDVVKINEFEGAVLHVGFRSTRIRTADGHTITIPNKKTADSAIVNISRRQSTRQTFNFGLVYETTPAQMEKAMAILREIFTGYRGYNPECPSRIGFFEYQDSALCIRVIAWHHRFDEHGKPTIPDYWEYFNWINETNMSVLRRFNEAGLSLAYPTRTTYLTSSPQKPLHVALDK